MRIVRVVTMVGMLVAVLGCATLSYPLPKCDGYAKRPLNRSMWDWDADKEQENQQQSSLADGSAITLAFAEQSAEPALEAATFAGIHEAGSHTACRTR